MRSIISYALMLAVLLPLSSNSFAEKDLFSYDKSEVKKEFAPLHQLQSKMPNKSKIQINDLNDELKNLASDLNVGESPSEEVEKLRTAEGEELPGEIPAFWWGFIPAIVGTCSFYGCWAGLVGVAVVYFITEDNDQTLNAVWGCLAGSLGAALIWTLWYLLIGASNIWWYGSTGYL